MRFVDVLKESSRWDRLRLIGNSHIAQSALAVPIVGYFILFNGHVIDYLQIHTAFCHGSACTVPWRLYFIYFGACGFALGSGLYALFCPALIKKFSGAAEFFEAEKVFYTQPRNLKALFDRIRARKGGPP